jgi:ATP-dependent helicase/nuclease subunit A
VVSYRDEVSLSDAQRAVLFDTTPRVLVAAGAGSGKTRLLVAYFVHALLDEDVPLEELAAVTFTRKAGSELADKIRKELVHRGRTDLVRAIDGAAIGTIHGLCRRVLSERALEAGVDPSFGVLEADAERLVKEEVSKQAWERVVQVAVEEELQVLAAGAQNLPGLVLSLYDRFRAMGQAEPRLHIDPGPPEAGARAELVRVCEDALAQVRALPKRGVSLEKDMATVVRCLQWLEETAAGPGPDRTVEATSGFFPTRNTSAAEPFFRPFRDALHRYRCALAEEELRPLLGVVNRLLAAFDQEYSAYKGARGVLDFADLELRARAMLTRAPGRSGVLDRVLVDEFQDTNELQCSIIDGLGAHKLLMVGDERQSIYGFRGADVGVFRRRQEASAFGQHRLDTNYRSRPQILDFVNHLFSSDTFFGEEKFKPLLPGRDVEGEMDVKATDVRWNTEVLVVERTVDDNGEVTVLDARSAEANAAAERVRRLVDEEGWAQREVVLLLPALSEVNTFQEALLAQGLQVYVVRGKGYYSQDEVADVRALLKLLVNPHDDLSLLTVLRSPLVGVSDDGLYLLGRAARSPRARSLWEVVREGRAAVLEEADRQKLDAFAARLDTLRGRVGRPGLSRLIDDAASACDYDLCLLAAPEGKRRFANLRKLMRMASDFESLEGPDLEGFVSLISSLGDLGDDEGNAASLAEGEEVVRIMTIHQAKGLEFPVVVLAGLGSDPPKDSAESFVVASDGRVGAFSLSINKTYESDYPHWGPAPEILAENRCRKEEEDLRLLYVAMTRARDRLVLVGARKAGEKSEARRIGRIVTALGASAPLVPGEILPLDHIHAAVVGVAAVPVSSDQATGPEDEPEDCPPTRPAQEPPCFLSLPAPGVAARQISFSALSAYERCPRQFYLERVLGLSAEFGAAATAEGSPAQEDTGEPQASPGREEALLDPAERAGGRDVGLLVHALLQQIDLAGERPAVASLDELGEWISAENGLGLADAAVQRAAELAAAFWDSPLAGASGVASALREAPFSFVRDGVSVQGVMDLLLEGENCWRIVDYKSNALGGRSPREVAEGYRLQADVYSLAALKAGAPAVHMEFLFLEEPQEMVGFEYGPEDEEALQNRLDEALAGIRRSHFPPAAGPLCRECSVEDLCRAMNGRRLVVE